MKKNKNDKNDETVKIRRIMKKQKHKDKIKIQK